MPTTPTRRATRRATRRHRCARCGHTAVYENAGVAEAREAAIDRTPKPCLHKEADHQHGTNACYHLDACRCLPCAEAARVYANDRSRKIAYGQWNQYVPGEFVRDHIAELQAYGIGPKRLAELSGVPHGAISKIVYGVYAPGPAGRNGRGDLVRGPSRRVRRSTAEAIYAVEPIPANLGSRVPDRERTPLARTHLRALVALGWSMSEIARRLGMNPSNIGRILTGDTAMARGTVDKAEALFACLCMTLPPATAAATRARQYATDHGWLPPLALDDEGDSPDPTDDVDEVAVRRRMDGDKTVRLNHAEQLPPAADLAGLRTTTQRARARHRVQRRPTRRRRLERPGGLLIPHTRHDRQATIEDLTFLADHGVGMTEAATRTGFDNGHSLERWLRRIGQGDLATTLYRQDYESVTPSRKQHHLGGRRVG